MDDSERAMEIEALSAIFVEGEELQIVGDNELSLLCAPRRHDDAAACAMRIAFTLPEGYPGEESLDYRITEEQGIDHATRTRILELIEEVIEQNRGMPAVYPIVEAVNVGGTHHMIFKNAQEQLMHCVPATGEAGVGGAVGSSAEGAAGPDDQPETAENLDTGLHLKQLCRSEDRVTKEVFEEWSRKFRLEMISKGIWRDLDTGAGKGQLTGREMFESKAVDIDFEENENVFWNNEALYEGDCDEDALD